MKKCPHCGKDLPQEMQFCPYCMEKLMPETPVGDVPLRRRRRWWLWIVAALLLLLFLCGLWLCWLWLRHPAPAKDAAASLGGGVTTTTVSTAFTTTAQTDTATTTATTTTQSITVGTTTSAVPASQTGTASRTTSTTSRATSTTASAVTDLCARGHDWEPITETVHIDEVGHYVTATVEKRVTVFRCALCYKEHLALDDYYAHFDAEHGGDALQGVFRDRYTEVMEYREVEEQQWVVDTPAYDKTVTVGRRCRVCGKTETDKDKE